LELYSLFEPKLGMEHAPRNREGRASRLAWSGCSWSASSTARSPIAYGWMPALLAGSLLDGYLGSHYVLK